MRAPWCYKQHVQTVTLACIVECIYIVPISLTEKKIHEVMKEVCIAQI